MVALQLLALLASFPFGEEPPAKPPDMGAQVGEMREIAEPDGLRSMIGSEVVSLIMFSEGSEDDNESNWFMLFQIMVEKSIDLKRGDARVNWPGLTTRCCAAAVRGSSGLREFICFRATTSAACSSR